MISLSFGLCLRRRLAEITPPCQVSVTWFNSDHYIASRVDKFFVSKIIGDKLISASVVPFPLSDRDVINLHIDLGNYVSSGPGLILSLIFPY